MFFIDKMDLTREMPDKKEFDEKINLWCVGADDDPEHRLKKTIGQEDILVNMTDVEVLFENDLE
jgi:hypothetical protein